MRPSTRTTLVVVAGTVAVVVATRSVPVHRPSRPASSSPMRVMVTPSSPPGLAGASRETATAAARRILATYATYPGLPLAEAEASLRGISSVGGMDHLVGELDADLARLAAGYPGGPTKVWDGYMASRESGDDENARQVQVWLARVVAPPDRPVYVEWRLATVALVWERDGWRLDRFDETAGPRPLSLPGTADSAEAILSAIGGFTPEAS